MTNKQSLRCCYENKKTKRHNCAVVLCIISSNVSAKPFTNWFVLDPREIETQMVFMIPFGLLALSYKSIALRNNRKEWKSYHLLKVALDMGRKRNTFNKEGGY